MRYKPGERNEKVKKEYRKKFGMPPMLFTRYYLFRGQLVRETVREVDLQERGLRNCSSLLSILKAGGEKVTRAILRFGKAQEISLGLPPGLLDGPAPPEFETFSRNWPGHLFVVSSSEEGILAVNLLVPASAQVEEVSRLTCFMVLISGKPDLPDEYAAELQRQTISEILANRPALVTVVFNPPESDEQLADLLGFNMHFGAAIFLEHSQPATAPAPPQAKGHDLTAQEYLKRGLILLLHNENFSC